MQQGSGGAPGLPRAVALATLVAAAVVVFGAAPSGGSGGTTAGAPLATLAPLPAAQGTAQDAWSPDAAALVYTSQASGNADLWLGAGPLGEAKNLTNNPAQDHWASWFPDGERLAFQTRRDGNREVYLMDADGGVTNLTHHPAEDLLPEVSPDGSRILFFSDREVPHGPRELPGHLYVMDADGSNVERVTERALTSTFFGAWSPDARTIVFARDFEGPDLESRDLESAELESNVDLVLLDLDGGVERRLPGTEASEYGARFSPEGSRLAFHAAGDGDEARIVVMDVDGTRRREITSGGQHYDPHWSPDGRWLMFTGAPLGANRFDLMIVPAEGGDPRPLVVGEVDERSGSWRPPR